MSAATPTVSNYGCCCLPKRWLGASADMVGRTAASAAGVAALALKSGWFLLCTSGYLLTGNWKDAKSAFLYMLKNIALMFLCVKWTVKSLLFAIIFFVSSGNSHLDCLNDFFY